MKINQIFHNDIHRPINGVVKAEQLDNSIVFTELDEYVITNELSKHFAAFFDAYMPSVIDPQAKALTGKLGIWVSGFFGSGKSHFIKILSYLLQNIEVNDGGVSKTATEIFQTKPLDGLLMSDISSAVTKQNTVILFNIDSRANTDDGDDAILKVFLKVFNEQLGYSGDYPHIANLERQLDKRGEFERFKQTFAQLTGKDWLAARDSYYFHYDKLAEALAQVTEQSLESAKRWVEQIEDNFSLDVTNFCQGLMIIWMLM